MCFEMAALTKLASCRSIFCVEASKWIPLLPPPELARDSHTIPYTAASTSFLLGLYEIFQSLVCIVRSQWPVRIFEINWRGRFRVYITPLSSRKHPSWTLQLLLRRALIGSLLRHVLVCPSFVALDFGSIQ